TIGAFPPDPTESSFPGDTSAGEWTRFGAAYAGIEIIQDPATAPQGERYLQVAADWTAGQRVGVRYIPYEIVSDWDGYTHAHFTARAIGSTTGTTIQFAVFEEDGDVWVSSDLPIGSEWDEYAVDLLQDLHSNSTEGDGIFATSPIILFGWNVDNADNTGTQSIHFDNVRLGDVTSSISDWMFVY
ncbi:MAG: hypothetical protein JJU11_18475, partial [Candidatus Sumerlaeia bacterium]|nr:hypothetical protein [Candidatus Sumerlaeia bacterium]